MAAILLVYATGEGQTAKVAARIARVLAERDHSVDRVDLGDRPGAIEVDRYDGVLVGGSVHVGRHQRELTAFARANRDRLSATPSGFFQVCLSAAVPDVDRQAEVDRYLAEFIAATGWGPDRTASFGGALRYSEYGFVKRRVMRRIAAGSTGDTDASGDYEYTDWDAVEAFAADFAALVEARGSAAGPPEPTAPP